MDFVSASLRQLKDDLDHAADTHITDLARSLVKNATAYELQTLSSLGLPPRMSHLQRDQADPQDYTDDIVLSAAWADDMQAPLEVGEQWNEGRRATNTGIKYTFNAAGLPINPYANVGLNGRGLLGAFAVNHAVDNGVLVIRPDANDIPTLYALGILRKHDNNQPAFSGGFIKFRKNDQGIYIVDRDSIIDSQVEELFEEMISGSVPLDPDAGVLINKRVYERIESYKKANDHREPDDDYKQEIVDQESTQLKLEQVKLNDPGFFERLRDFVASGHECFAGPVLNDPRTTNTAWIESRMSWVMLDEKKWLEILGDNPHYPYEFAAGDDSSGIVYHRLDMDFVTKAYASQGAMACFMMASYLLKSQREGSVILPAVLAQIEQLNNEISAYAHRSFGHDPHLSHRV